MRARSALARLHALRGTFGVDARREKARLLSALSHARWPEAAILHAWQDELLFIVAFPDSKSLHRAARRALTRIGAQMRALRPSQRMLLADTGLAGSETSHTFMHGVVRWLAAAGEPLSFEFDDASDAERLDTLLRLNLTAAELDRFDSGEVGTLEWMTEAASGLSGGPVPWLVASDGGTRIARDLYDAAEVPVRWRIGESMRSTSRNVRPVPPIVRTGFRTLPNDPIELIAAPLPGIRRATGREADRWHDASLSALVARAREVFPTIYCDRREVHLAPLGEGATLCLLGLGPEDRSALESNYGYVIFANGVPIGYGGFTPLAAQANTGANLFESFRRSEAAYLFAQSLRACRTLFGVTRFVVNPFQLGAGNDEAISTGAYWFYDRLGFRHTDPELERLAARERAAIARDRRHRSSRRSLRSLSGGDVVLTLPGNRTTPLVPERLLVDSGALATRAMSGIPASDRERWIRREARALMRRCTGERRSLSRAELCGARLLVPVLAPLSQRIEQWPRSDRRALWSLVAMKGAAQEVEFARAAGRHPRLWKALLALTEG